MVTVPTDQQVFRLSIRVGKQHIDNLNHVNNVVYVSWVQDVADAHWKSAASEELRRQCRWVVLRHLVDYLVPALEGDELQLVTWVDPSEGAKSVRHVSIQRSSDQKVLVHAQTTWCLLDPQSGRPKRVTRDIEQVLR